MSDITIRSARQTDADAIRELAALDSRRVPAGDLLVAEQDGRVVAAVAPASLEAIADPFERTAGAVALLRQQSTMRRDAGPARRHLRLVARAA